MWGQIYIYQIEFIQGECVQSILLFTISDWYESNFHVKWAEEDRFWSVQYTCKRCPISLCSICLDDVTFDLLYLYRKSAELVEALLKLSDLGHYQQVSELFKFPVQHCPDLLVINLLQTSVCKVSIAYIVMISALTGNCIMMKHRWYVGALIGMFSYQQYMKWWDPRVTGLLPLQHLWMCRLTNQSVLTSESVYFA